jgi:hypothetical protein
MTSTFQDDRLQIQDDNLASDGEIWKCLGLRGDGYIILVCQ